MTLDALAVLGLGFLSTAGSVYSGVLAIDALWRVLIDDQPAALRKAFVEAYEKVVDSCTVGQAVTPSRLEQTLNRCFSELEDDHDGQESPFCLTPKALTTRLELSLRAGLSILAPDDNPENLRAEQIVEQWSREFLLLVYRSRKLDPYLRQHDADVHEVISRRLESIQAVVGTLDPAVACAQLCIDIASNYAASIEDWYSRSVPAAIPLSAQSVSDESGVDKDAFDHGVGGRPVLDHGMGGKRGTPLPVLSIVDRSDDGIFLTGGPGAGKTTTLRWLTRALATRVSESSLTIPIYADLGDINRISGSQPLEQLLNTFLLRHARTSANVRYLLRGEALQFLGEMRSQGVQFVLLLDGLDRAYQQSELVRDYATGAMQSGDKIIMSSRPRSIEMSNLAHYSLASLGTPDEQRRCLAEYEASVHRCAEGDRVEPCPECQQRAVHRWMAIAEMVLDVTVMANPLHLNMAWTLLNQGFGSRGSRRMNLAQLYRAFVTIALGRTRCGGELHHDTLAQAPTALAAWWFSKKAIATSHWGLPYLEIGGWPGDHITSGHFGGVLDDLSLGTSLISYDGVDVTMLHPTFEEYFAASWLTCGGTAYSAASRTPIPLQAEH